MCYANNKKWKKQITEGKELPNQERIIMIREKETYKYLGKVEGDAIKQEVIKDNPPPKK